MEIIDFSDREFGEINIQDNPAFMKKEDWEKIGQNSCVLITKQKKGNVPYKSCGNFCVFEIKPVENPYEEDSVSRIGFFWELEHAFLFAKSFSERFK